MRDDRWVDVDEEENAGERHALDYLKAHLPDAEPYRAWASFEFPRKDHPFAQVDCLVVGPRAIFLVEIKNWNGELYGTSMRWEHIRPYKHGDEKSPLDLANKKARWFKGVLEKSKLFRGEGAPPVPRVEALVFMAGNDFHCRLDGDARKAIHGYNDPLPLGVRQDGGLTGIIDAIAGFEGGAPIDSAASERIAKAMKSVGIIPSTRFSQVGQAVLGEPITQSAEGSVFKAHDSSAPDTHYRVVFHHPRSGEAGDPDQAMRAALREYRLLSPAGTTNAGLPRAVEFDAENPRGSAVVFTAHPDARPLDQFLAEKGDELDTDARVELVRKIGEALEYAHGRRMFHRALRPEAILVHREVDGSWQPVITGWHTGLRDEAAEGGPGAVTGTSHFTGEDRSWLRYRAPEFMAAHPLPRLLDVFGLGALAHLILSGSEPPEDQAAAFVAAGGRLDPRAADPSLDPALCEEVGAATAEDAEERTETVGAFLSDLEAASSEGTHSEAASAEATEVVEASRRDPAALQSGWELGRFTVTQRLGEGSSGVAAIAHRDDGVVGVLKVAKTSEYDERIAEEGSLLSRIRSRTVVALIEGPIELEGRQAIFLGEADKGTLRDVIRESGSQPIEDVARWGDDLLAALEDLEKLGHHHRDIKPDNIGLMQLRNGDQAILMDFSLASSPVDEIYLGTEPYRDPFLDERPELRFDPAADRYAAAVVLHEALTGEVPRWGDGRNVPRLCELELAVDVFPEQHVDQLVGFFTRALNKEVTARFTSAREMARAWSDVFVLTAPVAPVPEVPSEPAAATAEEFEKSETAPPEVAALVFNMSAQKFSVSFRKSRGQVTAADVGAVDQLLSEVPPAHLTYIASKKRWILDPTPENAALLFELSDKRECAIRDSARRVMEFRIAERPDLKPAARDEAQGIGEQVDDSGAGATTRVGLFEVTGSIGGEDFTGTTPSKVERVPGRRSVYRLRLLPEGAGEEDVGLKIAYEKFNNGERQIRVLDACGSGPRFELLTSRNRLSVSEYDEHLRLDLAQARIRAPVENPDRAGLFNADRDLLDEGAATDVLGTLTELGAIGVGLKSEVLGTEGPTSNRYCAIIKRDDDLTPIAAYVMTRVAPIYQRLPK